MDQIIPFISKYLSVQQMSKLLSCSKSMRPIDYDLQVRDGVFYKDGSILQNNGFSKSWYYEKKLHREHDQPARVFLANGTMEWHIHGEKHRDGDKPAYISYHRRSIVFFKNNKIHRDDGPALIIEGVREMWYKNGKIHNGYDQPAAIVYLQHNRIRREWWNEGKYLKMDIIR